MKITVCKNYFDRSDRENYAVEWSNKTILQLIEDLKLPQIPFIPSINGKVVADLNIVPAKEDHLVLVPTLMSDVFRWADPFGYGLSEGRFRGGWSQGSKGEHGHGFWNFFLPIDLDPSGLTGNIDKEVDDFARRNPWFAAAVIGVVGLFFKPAAAWLAYVYQNHVMDKPGDMPDFPDFPGGPNGTLGDSPSSSFEQSNSYGWSPQTIQQIGATVPKIYGTFKAEGNIITGFIDTVGSGDKKDDQVLYSLMLLGQGPISDIREIKVNGQDVSEFVDVTYETRNGYLNQEVIKNFNDTKTEIPANYQLEQNNEYIYTTTESNFDALDIILSFPKGLYFVTPSTLENIYQEICPAVPPGQEIPPCDHYLIGVQSSGGETVEQTVEFSISYRKDSETEWTDYGTLNVTDKKTSSFTRYFRIATDTSHETYHIKITRITEDFPTDNNRFHDSYFGGVRIVLYDDFSYPSLALVGLKALATGQISGGLDFSCIVDGSLVRVWDGAVWTVQFSNNPAWVAYDILTQPVFDTTNATGMEYGRTDIYVADPNVLVFRGEDPANVDLTSFKAWADFCDEEVWSGKYDANVQKVMEKRFEFDGIFDNPYSVWDSVTMIAGTTRASIIIKGYKYYVALEKASTPVQLFTAGNIIKDSFKEVFISLDNRASQLDVEFMNKENNYKRELVTVINPDVEDDKKISSRQYIGIVRPSQAWRTARFELYSNEYLSRIIEFKADVDAITCSAGDLIYFAHELPQWGYSGRIASATTSTIVLDREVAMTAGQTYCLKYRKTNDTIYTVYPTTVATGATYTLNILPTLGTGEVPELYDVYSFGLVNYETKTFRVNSIQPEPDLRFNIRAIEYNSTIYNVDTDQPVLPTPNYSSLNILPPVTNIVLDEVVTRRQDGSLQENIDVSWVKPSNYNYNHCEIWYKSTAVNTYQYAGRSFTTEFRITNVPIPQNSSGVKSADYTVRIVTVNNVGQKTNLESAPYKVLNLAGKDDAPSNVTGFTAKQKGDTLNFHWTHITDFDLLGYQIRVGTIWETGTILSNRISENFFSWKPEANGTYKFFIKALDTTGHYSPTATSVIITTTGIDPSLNIVYDYDETQGTGAATGTAWNFTVGTGQTGLPYTLIFTPSAGTGWYYTDSIDFLKIGVKTIRLMDSVDSWDTEATDLSYPDRTDSDHPDDTDTHWTADVFKWLFYSYSDDEVTWSGWKIYRGAINESFRYLITGIQARVPSITAEFEVYSFRTIVDVPETNYQIYNYHITQATGHRVMFSTYDLVYYATPGVYGTVTAASSLCHPIIPEKDSTGFTINLIDIANEHIDGYVDILVRGY